MKIMIASYVKLFYTSKNGIAPTAIKFIQLKLTHELQK